MAMCTLSNDYRAYLQHNDQDMKYGLPGKKKYPMPDRDHVMSAIKFFNYVSPSDEEELARNILNRIREYGIEDINVGEDNRFGKYYKADDHLEHHGVKGQHWGERRYQNLDGSLTPLGREHYGYGKARGNASVNKEFVKSKLQYVDKELSKYKKQQETPKYQKKNAEAQKLQSELDKLKPQTDKIRDKKLFKDKNPNVLEQLKINKEAKLQAKLDKRNKYLNAINEKVDSLNQRQEHYKSILNDFASGKFKGGISEAASDTLKHIISGDYNRTNQYFQEELVSDIKRASRSILKPYPEAVKVEERLEGSTILNKVSELTRKDYLDYKKVASDYYDKAVKSEQAQEDKDRYWKARDKYESKLKKYAERILGEEYKDKTIKVSYPKAYEGQDVIDSKTMSEVVADSLWNINRKYNLKNDSETREAVKQSRRDGYNSLTDKQKKLIKEFKTDIDDMILEGGTTTKSARKFIDSTLGKSDQKISGADFDGDTVIRLAKATAKPIHSLSTADFDGDKVVTFKNDAATREAMRIAKSDGWVSLTKKQKELLEEAYEG